MTLEKQPQNSQLFWEVKSISFNLNNNCVLFQENIVAYERAIDDL